MDAPDASLLPPKRSALPTSLSVCMVACAVVLPPLLYVGSFVLLALDAGLGWGIIHPLDEGTAAAFRFVYWPLEWLMEQVADRAGYKA